MWKAVTIVALLLAASQPAEAAQLELVRVRLGPAAAGAIIGGAAALGLMMMHGPRRVGPRHLSEGKRPQQHPGSSSGQAARSSSSHDPDGHQSASLKGPVPASPVKAGPPDMQDAKGAPGSGPPPDAGPAPAADQPDAGPAPAADLPRHFCVAESRVDAVRFPRL